MTPTINLTTLRSAIRKSRSSGAVGERRIRGEEVGADAADGEHGRGHVDPGRLESADGRARHDQETDHPHEGEGAGAHRLLERPPGSVAGDLAERGRPHRHDDPLAAREQRPAGQDRRDLPDGEARTA